MRSGFGLLRDRPDKDYSLTDCVSFVLMRERGHFEQEGLVREPYEG